MSSLPFSVYPWLSCHVFSSILRLSLAIPSLCLFFHPPPSLGYPVMSSLPFSPQPWLSYPVMSSLPFSVYFWLSCHVFFSILRLFLAILSCLLFHSPSILCYPVMSSLPFSAHPWLKGSGQGSLMTRVGRNNTFIGIYGVYTVILAGKSPYIRSYMVCIYGSGQPYS